MTENSFTLLDLILENKIKGLIFDKFGQKNHFRLFPFKQKILGSFEAFISATIILRYQSKLLMGLELSQNDKKILLYAFIHREEIGTPDGMSNIDEIETTNVVFSAGSIEDNFIVDNNVLIQLYENIGNLTKIKKPLPKPLQKLLSLSLTLCYFDKAPLDGESSICDSCAQELRNEGYLIPDSIIGKIFINKS